MESNKGFILDNREDAIIESYINLYILKEFHSPLSTYNNHKQWSSRFNNVFDSLVFIALESCIGGVINDG